MEKKNVKSIDLAIRYKLIDFRIASLTQEITPNGYKFYFTPNYEVIDLLPSNVFSGIQGINLDLRRKKYIRDNIPVFLQERIPPKNRVNIQSILKYYNLKYYDPLSLYLAEKEKYGGDNISPLSFFKKKIVKCRLKNQTNLYPAIKNIISNFAAGNKVYVDDKKINVEIVKDYLFPIYESLLKSKQEYQRKGVEKRISNNSYLGRKPIKINERELFEIYKGYLNKTLTEKQALDLLDISRSTFFRKTKSFKNKMNTIETKK